MDMGERQRRLIKVLINEAVVPMSRLAREFGVCVKTVQRDIDALIVDGYPIDMKKGNGGGVFMTNRNNVQRCLNYIEINALNKAINRAFLTDEDISVLQNVKRIYT
ncbi:hypothetical protein FACS1894133_4410 [Clostridia bacterium]|nr:hypothetical protein FACS1894133_4410 [Clostridia bacterium]